MIALVMVRLQFRPTVDWCDTTSFRPAIRISVCGAPEKRRPFVNAIGMLLHVLCEVCFLRVRFAAELTYMRLEMLRLLVLRYVFKQTRFVDEALVTRVALIRLVRLMTARVRLQVRQLAECCLKIK